MFVGLLSPYFARFSRGCEIHKESAFQRVTIPLLGNIFPKRTMETTDLRQKPFSRVLHSVGPNCRGHPCIGCCPMSFSMALSSNACIRGRRSELSGTTAFEQKPEARLCSYLLASCWRLQCAMQGHQTIQGFKPVRVRQQTVISTQDAVNYSKP